MFQTKQSGFKGFEFQASDLESNKAPKIDYRVPSNIRSQVTI